VSARTVSDRLSQTAVDAGVYRSLAAAGLLTLTASYVAVLHDLATVVGDSGLLLPVTVVSLLGGVALSRLVSVRTAILLGAGLAAGGYAYYLVVTPGELGVLITATDRIISDAIAMLTGYSVLRMTKAHIWSLGFAPAPVFLSWFLLARRRYVLSVATGGIALLVLVLTGDAGTVPTLLGVVGAVAVVGFGELERRDGTMLQADVLVVLVVVMAVSSLWLPAVGGTENRPLFLVPGSDGSGGGGLAESTDRMTIQGETELSSQVRFTVESERAEYWRVATYDRFTGREWIRSGTSADLNGQLSGPPGDSMTVEQRVEVETPMRAIPAAAEPVSVSGDASGPARVTTQGGLTTDSPLSQGDTYTVESEVVTASPGQLRTAGTDYPDRISDRDYTQLPDDTPDRVGERTAEIVDGLDNPYDKAVAIERWLERNKGYSLEVERPEGNIADQFLFEMDEGYCTYFATTMVTMLREEGIPARMVTGYTSGQQVDNDTYVVRGVDAHAWVEVYFPDHGWVQFDPTPSDERTDAERDTVQDARQSGANGVDTDQSRGEPLRETTSSTTGSETASDRSNQSRYALTPNEGDPDNQPQLGDIEGTSDTATVGNGATSVSTSDDDTATGEDDPSVPTPPPETVAWTLFLGLGLVAGAHRTGLTEKTYRLVRLHWQGARQSPDADVERAVERLDVLLAREYRPRRPGETRREYFDTLSLAGLDDRAERVIRIHERARYGDGVTREEAETAIRLVDSLVRERTPVVRRVART
jgi:transglutaminase-like putative cysteine protease